MVKKLIFTFLFGISFGIIGLILGTFIGGNYYTEFIFLGGRGYEATGYLGIIIGGLIGLVLGWFLSHKKPTNKL